MATYEPAGVRFYDQVRRREMMLVTDGWAAGWICYRHPDGQWVTLRQATDDDRRKVLTDLRPRPA